MTKRLEPEEQARFLAALAGLLEQARRERRTLTYLQIADALAMPGPHRIHKTTRLIELLLKQEVTAGRLPRAALAVSRARPGRPAPGFFDRARRLGLFDGQDSDAFHEGLLERLFAADRA
ncbi:hypothetical protein [Wenzhouxiangella marina]|uniref:Uncharacterized protein n=1 Tax=Wenzhouxiangella marina TaxID=1579979 RepID=A0A0K0XVC2_9GAMM|nr:hypothetical protein [Wenzhouxiangella marina]AKS41628.1 hypothetical protein WM2015_1254 [Wenzhouxiangella marina]MBB6086612.1 hypothetical protein [Wenzhouxiangella marina]